MLKAFQERIYQKAGADFADLKGNLLKGRNGITDGLTTTESQRKDKDSSPIRTLENNRQSQLETLDVKRSLETVARSPKYTPIVIPLKGRLSLHSGRPLRPRNKPVADASVDLDKEVKLAQDRKRQLLQELKQVDLRLKDLKEQKAVSRQKLLSKANKKPAPEEVAERNQKALELVKKLNQERRLRENKKMEQSRKVQKHFSESIEKVRERQRLAEEEARSNKRRLIAQRMKEGKYGQQLLKNINHQSDKFISEMTSPDSLSRNQGVFELTALDKHSSLTEHAARLSSEGALPAVAKRYPKSNFLKAIQKQERHAKLLKQLKEREKRLLLEKRLSYGHIIQNQYIQPSSTEEQSVKAKDSDFYTKSNSAADLIPSKIKNQVKAD